MKHDPQYIVEEYPMLPPPAVLAHPTGTHIALAIQGYQFAWADDEDDDWLMVALIADDGQERWKATAPALLTWEVAQLIDWLRAIAAGDRSKPRIDFIEPELAFEADEASEEACLMVTLAYSFQPPWIPEIKARTVRVRPGTAGLRSCADVLAAALARFPVRKLRDGSDARA